MSSDASTSVGVVVLHEGLLLRVPALREHLGADLLAQRAPALDGPLEPVLLDARMARSKAAHTMTREWVKCRSGPRISHSPLSGLVPVVGEVVDEGALQVPGVVGLGEPRLPGVLEGDHHLAEHVGLALPHGAVADADRPRAGVARQVVELALRQVPRRRRRGT